jgi:hypothetical protein
MYNFKTVSVGSAFSADKSKENIKTVWLHSEYSARLFALRTNAAAKDAEQHLL